MTYNKIYKTNSFEKSKLIIAKLLYSHKMRAWEAIQNNLLVF